MKYIPKAKLPKNAAAKKTANPPAKAVASAEAARRSGIKFNPQERKNLYAAAQYLNSEVEKKCGLQIPFEAYLQDPSLAKTQPKEAFDRKFYVDWEPGLADGPTSARFAVVDYNGDSGHLVPPATWNNKEHQFMSGGQALNEASAKQFQFHQVSVWALLQRALAFFEEGNGLGRRIQWGFEGNRLIVVPHAGYGQNAFYDRESKSLQFYYFETEEETIYTCLSTDIVYHEFGHAVLDGVRPYYNESSLVQTAAFHEAVGDITAILMNLRNNAFRQWLAEKTAGNLSKPNPLAYIAEQFGQAVKGKPYLRNGLNKLKMSDVAGSTSPHDMSEVLLGAMFDVLRRMAERYVTTPDRSPLQAFWDLAGRMQRMSVQPLDLLPPVEVTFRDYALAVIRAEQLANPLDPDNYRDLLIEVFRWREIISAEDEKKLNESHYLYDRQRLSVYHHIEDIARSRAAAYRFLDDNREELFIPSNQDFIISDLYDTHKLGRAAAPLPRQVVLEYVWREDVTLRGREFGRFDGQTTSMLCGGTLVFDDTGNILSWARKPGTQATIRKTKGKREDEEAKEVAAGEERLREFLTAIAGQIAAGRVGNIQGSEKGLLGTRVPPVIATEDDGAVRFRLSPHLKISDHQHEEDDLGERQWEISS
jgi:hypothetical protein